MRLVWAQYGLNDRDASWISPKAAGSGEARVSKWIRNFRISKLIFFRSNSEGLYNLSK